MQIPYPLLNSWDGEAQHRWALRRERGNTTHRFEYRLVAEHVPALAGNARIPTASIDGAR